MGNSCKKPPSVSNRGEYNVDGYLEVIERDRQLITVLEIGHYRDTFQSSGMELMHAFIGLRVRVEDRERLIKAEKSPEEIKISIVESLETNGTEKKHGPVGVQDCGEILTGNLLAILKEHSPDYSLISDNCWLYADSTYRRLIRNFSAHPTISPERRSELEGFLNHPAPPMPFYVILHSLLASLGGVVAEVGLAVVASIGASVLAAYAVAVNLFPPKQLAQVVVILRSPTVQNSVRDIGATVAQGVFRTMPMQAAAPAALYQILSPLSPAVAVAGCPFYWPFAIAILGSVVLLNVYIILPLALEAFPRVQLPRRRTGPSMPLL